MNGLMGGYKFLVPLFGAGIFCLTERFVCPKAYCEEGTVIKMKISIISFGRSKNGNCADIKRELCRLLENGNDVKTFDFSALGVNPCGGCRYECFERAESCPYINDSLYSLYDGITNGGLAYFILPNYCDYPCSSFFVFNERSQCYFQKRPELLEKYLSVPKKFIVVSNTGRDNFTTAFRYHIGEGEEPEILFLSAKSFGRVSVKGDLMESELAREAVRRFAKKPFLRDISFEPLTESNIGEVRKIQRDDISTDFVDDADTIMELTRYGIKHNCIGDTYAIKYKSEYIGVILLGEAIEWETDPPEMSERPFYRLMGFVIDKSCRGLGIGSYVLEKTIAMCYEKYGARPIALGVHRDNAGAARFYLRHGFKETEYTEGEDRYYLRYPNGQTKTS